MLLPLTILFFSDSGRKSKQCDQSHFPVKERYFITQCTFGRTWLWKCYAEGEYAVPFNNQPIKLW